MSKRKSLGKYIGNLIFGANVNDGDDLLDDMITEVMKLHGEMLGARSGLVLGCNLDTAPVILESATSDPRRSRMDGKSA